MKKITVWCAAVVMCFGLMAATPQEADARRWRGWGVGLAAGVIGAGLLYSAYRPYYGGYYGYGHRSPYYRRYRPYYASYYSRSYSYYRPSYASYYSPSYTYYRPYRYTSYYSYPGYYRRPWKGWW